MALARESSMENSHPGFCQALGPLPQRFDPSPTVELFGFKGYHNPMLEDGGFDLAMLSNPLNNSSPLQDQHLPALANFRSYSGSSLLSFEQRSEASYPKLDHEDLECGNWLQEDGGQELHGAQKRPYMGDDMQISKKHCGNGKKTKGITSPAKDPQSMAAKNRRERISERLKMLQELVPNGTKVDLVTMLEKAISYVKFLQLQVKVLATDEFWPTQGGKAPEVTQVKDAIDAILASHRER